MGSPGEKKTIDCGKKVESHYFCSKFLVRLRTRKSDKLKKNRKNGLMNVGYLAVF